MKAGHEQGVNDRPCSVYTYLIKGLEDCDVSVVPTSCKCQFTNCRLSSGFERACRGVDQSYGWSSSVKSSWRSSAVASVVLCSKSQNTCCTAVCHHDHDPHASLANWWWMYKFDFQMPCDTDTAILDHRVCNAPSPLACSDVVCCRTLQKTWFEGHV